MTMTDTGIGTRTKSPRWIKGLLVLGLAAIACLAALPHYVNGQWPWTDPPQVAHIEPLQQLKQQGLDLPGWAKGSSQMLPINGHEWNFSEFTAAGQATPAAAVDQFGLLLRPQPWHSDQPTVEWVDLKGAQGWQTNQRQVVRFRGNANGAEARVQAQYYRAWNSQHTFAVLQWYAWPTGGSYAPGRWFWADQRCQWQTRQRLPWVAVSLLIPMVPLGDVEPQREAAIALGSQVQTALMAGALTAAALPPDS